MFSRRPWGYANPDRMFALRKTSHDCVLHLDDKLLGARLKSEPRGLVEQVEEGYVARDKESKYVLLLNNDAVLFRGGLKTLVKYAENDDRVAGLQGVVLKYGTRLIDTAGDCIDEMLLMYPIDSDKRYPWILRRPMYVSFTDASCTLYRVKHTLNCFGNKLFVDEFFAYGDDNVLVLTLWDHGHKLASIPEAVAEHVRKLTLGKPNPDVFNHEK